MLTITIPECELWDESREEFIILNQQKIEMEHSLVSLSKWESKWCKPFYGKTEKTEEEILDYVKCMTLTKGVSDSTYSRLTSRNITEINDYIAAPMTATWFNDVKQSSSNGEQITAELIYYYMIAFNIPFECQKWHFNRLMTLIRVCSIKNQPQKKMSKQEILSRNKALNEARKQKLHTKG